MLLDLSLNEVSAYATLATAAIALVALAVACIQIYINKRETRLGVAKGIYKDYLSLAFANPKFSSASYPKEAPRMQNFERDIEEYERYEYFVSYLLFAAEDVLDLTNNSPAWRSTLRDQLRYHGNFQQKFRGLPPW